MKSIILILTFFLFSIALTCCNHESESCPACGVDNPSENLPWLKATINLSYATDYQSLLKIDLYEFKAKQLILFTWKLNGIDDLPTGAIYNCSGEVLYSCGGNQPFDSCSYIINNSKYIGNIWTRNNAL
jgi:hypothetical protein